VPVWRLASTSLPFNPCHLLLNFSKIILAFSCNFWISYLMRLSAPLNSTTFIYAHEIDCLHLLNSTTFIHMLLLFIVMFSGFLPSKTPSLRKRFAMDFLHHRIAWLPCALSPFVSNLLMNLFFFLLRRRRRQLGYPKNEIYHKPLKITTIPFGQSFVATRHFL
jgi:hypothetical protein